MLDIIEFFFLFYCFNVRPKATTTNYLSLFLHRFCIEQTVYILKKVCEKKKIKMGILKEANSHIWLKLKSLDFMEVLCEFSNKCIAKNLLQISASVLISVTIFLSIKKDRISWIFLSLWKVFRVDWYPLT